MARPKRRFPIPRTVERTPSTNEILRYVHCRLCLRDLDRVGGQSPGAFARLSIGFTPAGLQVWCERHNVNVMHIDFEGQQHPANVGLQRP